MIPVSKAIKIIERETRSLAKETVKLERSVGRVLAQPVKADTDMPPFDRSQMDGYAVRAADTAAPPITLTLVGESAAGRGWHKRLKAGEAIRIMTGAPLPKGADAVQKIELTAENGDLVVIREAAQPAKYIVKKGAEIKRGSTLFTPGSRITERTIASLAAFGYSTVDVARQPIVTIMSTGSEIVPVSRKPGTDQIRNSNSVMLKALCEVAGAKPRIAGQTGDDLSKLKNAIVNAVTKKKSDVLVLTGGVSVGKYDLTKLALRELGSEIYFERVRLRPGKPTVFGRLKDTLVFGLPGNPVSAAVTFYLFVRTAILKMQNASSNRLPTGFAVLTADAKAAAERETYLPAKLSTDASGVLTATPLRWHGSSDFVGFAEAEVLIRLDRGSVALKDEVVEIVFI